MDLIRKQITRRKARECALQAIYSWQISNNDVRDIEIYFLTEHNMTGVNLDYFHELYFGVINNVNELDNLMIPYLFRGLNELGCIELAVLRIALFELSKCMDVPYKVAINEAIELSKIFGAEKSYKFINGVLDKVGYKIRPNKT